MQLFTITTNYFPTCSIDHITPLPLPSLLFPSLLSSSSRLIILSTSGHSKSHRYHGRGASIDLSMWIALNNIMSVEMTYNSMVKTATS